MSQVQTTTTTTEVGPLALWRTVAPAQDAPASEEDHVCESTVRVDPDGVLRLTSNHPSLVDGAEGRGQVFLACDWSGSMGHYLDDQLEMLLSFVDQVRAAEIAAGRCFVVIYASSVHLMLDAARADAREYIVNCGHPDLGTNFARPMKAIADMVTECGTPGCGATVYFSTDGESSNYHKELEHLKRVLTPGKLIPVMFGRNVHKMRPLAHPAEEVQPIAVTDIRKFLDLMSTSIMDLGHAEELVVHTGRGDSIPVSVVSNGETISGATTTLCHLDDGESVRVTNANGLEFQATVEFVDSDASELTPTQCVVSTLRRMQDTIAQALRGDEAAIQELLAAMSEMQDMLFDLPKDNALKAAVESAIAAMRKAAAEVARRVNADGSGASVMLGDEFAKVQRLATWMVTAEHGAARKTRRVVGQAMAAIDTLVLKHAASMRDVLDDVDALLPGVLLRAAPTEGLPECPITLGTEADNAAVVVLYGPGTDLNIEAVLQALEADPSTMDRRAQLVVAPVNNPACARAVQQCVLGAGAYARLAAEGTTLFRASMVAFVVLPIATQTPEQTRFLELVTDVVAMQLLCGITTGGRFSTVQAHAAAAWSLWAEGNVGAAVAMLPYYVAGLRKRKQLDAVTAQCVGNGFAIAHSNAGDSSLPNVYAGAVAMLAAAILGRLYDAAALVYEVARARTHFRLKDDYATASAELEALVAQLPVEYVLADEVVPAELLADRRVATNLNQIARGSTTHARSIASVLTAAVTATRVLPELTPDHPAVRAALEWLETHTKDQIRNPSAFVLAGTPTVPEVLRFVAHIEIIARNVAAIDANNGWIPEAVAAEVAAAVPTALAEVLSPSDALGLALLLLTSRGNTAEIRSRGVVNHDFDVLSLLPETDAARDAATLRLITLCNALLGAAKDDGRMPPSVKLGLVAAVLEMHKQAWTAAETGAETMTLCLEVLRQLPESPAMRRSEAMMCTLLKTACRVQGQRGLPKTLILKVLQAEQRHTLALLRACPIPVLKLDFVQAHFVANQVHQGTINARMGNPGTFIATPNKRHFNRQMRRLGVETNVLTTDLAQKEAELTVDALRDHSVQVDGTVFELGAVKIKFQRSPGYVKDGHTRGVSDWIATEVHYPARVEKRDGAGHWDNEWSKSVVAFRDSVIAQLRPGRSAQSAEAQPAAAAAAPEPVAEEVSEAAEALQMSLADALAALPAVEVAEDDW